MSITITINYEAAGIGSSQSGSFKLRGRKPEQVALEWWKELKWNNYNPRLKSIIINGSEDITEAVIALANAPLPPDGLPF